jgi:hypothetical protein
MSKYANLQKAIFSIFDSSAWKSEKIIVLPNNVLGQNLKEEFLRLTIIPGNPGINLKSVSGLVIIDIFVKAGNGPKRSYNIADKLDNYLVGKSLKTEIDSVVQFNNSAISIHGLDSDNKSLFRVNYTIPFNYFEV